MTLASLLVSSIVPFDPTIAVAAVASVMLTVFVAFMAFLALAPLVSSTWTEQLDASQSGGSALEANEAD
ncbi:hypothetical protein EA462_17245 [Natrarchaeobius halalkaliphilus]|uniref:Uncharacterized protein n=1 Tax=Natrarchaeobius halalkaliphilus TaxID=1679091 RepID=A0A3N6MQK3_9EURY|nr:hypothetical protein [Natrarchaeobius halalkaliphilus]RQG86099.1 hypothetical protein EA462_17245 [Natrarchaeobius halalkaliphilus]